MEDVAVAVAVMFDLRVASASYAGFLVGKASILRVFGCVLRVCLDCEDGCDDGPSLGSMFLHRVEGFCFSGNYPNSNPVGADSTTRMRSVSNEMIPNIDGFIGGLVCL
jgi:hypothetical protein